MTIFGVDVVFLKIFVLVLIIKMYFSNQFVLYFPLYEIL